MVFLTICIGKSLAGRSSDNNIDKGAQTNFTAFAEYIDEQWNENETQFNDRYFQGTASLMLIFQFLEKEIPKQSWYEGGYRANVIYYTVALFRRLIRQQFPGSELDLGQIWNKQGLAEPIQNSLIALAELVLLNLTSTTGQFTFSIPRLLLCKTPVSKSFVTEVNATTFLP